MLRLTLDEAGTFKGWTLLTALAEIKGHEERLGRSRPQGKAYSRDFRGPNWLDLRKAAAEYAELLMVREAFPTFPSYSQFRFRIGEHASWEAQASMVKGLGHLAGLIPL